MEHSFNPQKKPLRWLWRAINHPMFAIALGLHALLLFIPLPSEPETPPEPEPEETVKITKLVSKQKEQPVAKSPPKPKPPANTPPKPKAAPRQVVVKVPPPVPRSQVTPTVLPSTNVESSPEASPSGLNIQDYSEEFDGAMSGFLTNLNEEDAANQQTPYFLLRDNLSLIFSQASLAQKSPGELDENDVREGVETIGYASRIKANRVYEQLEQEWQSRGVDYQESGEYAGGPLYKLQKGDTVRYVNLIPVSGGSTFVVDWSKNPGS